jgi:6,7-dimethyl-8-ribityllumazine synthase
MVEAGVGSLMTAPDASPNIHPVDPQGRYAVVWSVYDPEITGGLLDGAREAWKRAGGTGDGLRVVEAPGSYELPQIAMALAGSGRFSGVVALGCLIRGETRHDEYIASAVADGLMRVSLDTGVPTAFGVLTANTRGQALDRAGGSRGNKGFEAMAACLAANHSIEAALAAEGLD